MKTRSSGNIGKSSCGKNSLDAVKVQNFENDLSDDDDASDAASNPRPSSINDKKEKHEKEHKLKANKSTHTVKKCILCASQTKSARKTMNNEKHIKFRLDEKYIKFLLNDCLGVPEHEFQFGSSQKKTLNQLHICYKDVEILDKALSVHFQIQKLSLDLSDMKTRLKDVLIRSFTNEGDDENLNLLNEICCSSDTLYNQIRQVASSSLRSQVLNCTKPMQMGKFSTDSTEINPGQESKEEEIKIEFDDVNFDFCEIDPLHDYCDVDDCCDSPSNLNPVTTEAAIEDKFTKTKEESDPEYEAYCCESNNESDDTDDDGKITIPNRSCRTHTKKVRSKSSKTYKNGSKPKLPRNEPNETFETKPDTQGSTKIKRIGLKKFQCRICRKILASKEEKNSHFDSEHGPGYRFPCEFCPNDYKSLSYLKSHILRAHKTERPFTCDKCPAKYADAHGLRKHTRHRHSSKGLDKIPCPICGKISKGKYNLTSHIRNIHKQGGCKKKTFVCEFCSKAYSNCDAFKKHKAKIHFSNDELSVCDECGKTLSDPRSLKKHKLSQHLKTFKYTCSLCGTGCLYKSHFDAHMKKSHSGLSSESQRNETNIEPVEPQSTI